MPISRNLLPDTIGHRAAASNDAYGKPTHAAAVSYPRSRNIPHEKLIEATGGQVVLRKGLAVFSAAIAINVDDLVVLPDATEHRVMLVRKARDGSGGDHHTTVEYV